MLGNDCLKASQLLLGLEPLGENCIHPHCISGRALFSQIQSTGQNQLRNNDGPAIRLKLSGCGSTWQEMSLEFRRQTSAQEVGHRSSDRRTLLWVQLPVNR